MILDRLTWQTMYYQTYGLNSESIAFIVPVQLHRTDPTDFLHADLHDATAT